MLIPLIGCIYVLSYIFLVHRCDVEQDEVSYYNMSLYRGREHFSTISS